MRWNMEIVGFKITGKRVKLTFKFLSGPLSGSTIDKTFIEEVKDNVRGSVSQEKHRSAGDA